MWLHILALFGWIVSLFSKSTERELGRKEIENSDLKAANELLKAQKTALEQKEDLREALRHHRF